MDGNTSFSVGITSKNHFFGLLVNLYHWQFIGTAYCSESSDLELKRPASQKGQSSTCENTACTSGSGRSDVVQGGSQLTQVDDKFSSGAGAIGPFLKILSANSVSHSMTTVDVSWCC